MTSGRYFKGFLVCLVLATWGLVYGEIFFGGADVVNVKIKKQDEQVKVATPLYLDAQLKIKKGWHIYSDRTEGTGLPTTIRLEEPKGFQLIDIKWPKTKVYTKDGVTYHGYEGTITPKLTIMPNSLKVFEKGNLVNIKLRVNWLGCSKTLCIPGKEEVIVPLTIGINKSSKWNSEDIEKSPPPKLTIALFFQMILGALVGGLLLNLMPCVFPIL